MGPLPGGRARRWYRAALADGLLHQWVTEATHQRDGEISTRQRPLTGVSSSPCPGTRPSSAGRDTSCQREFGLWPPRRDSIVFERLRDRAQAMVDPSVFLRTLGSRRDYGPRQTFAKNLFAAAGIRAAEDGSRVAVLASSPSAYAGEGAAAIADLRAAVERVLVAGRASELGAAADQVDGEVHDGMDVVAFLSDLLDRLGAPGAPAGTTTAPATPTAPTTPEGPR